MPGYDPVSADLQEMVNACRCLDKTGRQCRHRPKGDSPRQTMRSWHERLRTDGIRTRATTLPIRAARSVHSRTPEPSTGIPGAQGVASGPQAGERGMDGHKRVNGTKSHVLTGCLGFTLAVPVIAAGVHHAQATTAQLDRATEDRRALDRVTVRRHPRRCAEGRHGVDVHVSNRRMGLEGLAPLPIRWRSEATFGTHGDRYRRLAKHLEQDDTAGEDAVQITSFQRVVRTHSREPTLSG